jgi:hypothetical protein
MKAGYVFLGTLVLILAAIIGYMVMTQPAAQPVVVVEKEVQPTWLPWNWGWAQNPGTIFVSRPVPQFYPQIHHYGSHPAISTGPHRPSLPMPQTPMPPRPQPHAQHAAPPSRPSTPAAPTASPRPQMAP